MSAVLNPSPRSYADLCNLPENLTGEILNGVLHTQPRPAGQHTAGRIGIGSWPVWLAPWVRRSGRVVDH